MQLRPQADVERLEAEKDAEDHREPGSRRGYLQNDPVVVFKREHCD
jgi:hypothetical protein